MLRGLVGPKAPRRSQMLVDPAQQPRAPVGEGGELVGGEEGDRRRPVLDEVSHPVEKVGGDVDLTHVVGVLNEVDRRQQRRRGDVRAGDRHDGGLEAGRGLAGATRLQLEVDLEREQRTPRTALSKLVGEASSTRRSVLRGVSPTPRSSPWRSAARAPGWPVPGARPRLLPRPNAEVQCPGLAGEGLAPPG